MDTNDRSLDIEFAEKVLGLTKQEVAFPNLSKPILAFLNQNQILFYLPQQNIRLAIWRNLKDDQAGYAHPLPGFSLGIGELARLIIDIVIDGLHYFRVLKTANTYHATARLEKDSPLAVGDGSSWSKAATRCLVNGANKQKMVGADLKKIRSLLGMTQKDFGWVCNRHTQSSQYDFESGKKPVPAAVAEAALLMLQNSNEDGYMGSLKGLDQLL